jgi:hypothetical protein
MVRRRATILEGGRARVGSNLDGGIGCRFSRVHRGEREVRA